MFKKFLAILLALGLSTPSYAGAQPSVEDSHAEIQQMVNSEFVDVEAAALSIEILFSGKTRIDSEDQPMKIAGQMEWLFKYSTSPSLHVRRRATAHIIELITRYGLTLFEDRASAAVATAFGECLSFSDCLDLVTNLDSAAKNYPSETMEVITSLKSKISSLNFVGSQPNNEANKGAQSVLNYLLDSLFVTARFASSGILKRSGYVPQLSGVDITWIRSELARIENEDLKLFTTYKTGPNIFGQNVSVKQNPLLSAYVTDPKKLASISEEDTEIMKHLLKQMMVSVVLRTRKNEALKIYLDRINIRDEEQLENWFARLERDAAKETITRDNAAKGAIVQMVAEYFSPIESYLPFRQNWVRFATRIAENFSEVEKSQTLNLVSKCNIMASKRLLEVTNVLEVIQPKLHDKSQYYYLGESLLKKEKELSKRFKIFNSAFAQTHLFLKDYVAYNERIRQKNEVSKVDFMETNRRTKEAEVAQSFVLASWTKIVAYDELAKDEPMKSFKMTVGMPDKYQPKLAILGDLPFNPAMAFQIESANQIDFKINDYFKRTTSFKIVSREVVNVALTAIMLGSMVKVARAVHGTSKWLFGFDAAKNERVFLHVARFLAPRSQAYLMMKAATNFVFFDLYMRGVGFALYQDKRFFYDPNRTWGQYLVSTFLGVGLFRGLGGLGAISQRSGESMAGLASRLGLKNPSGLGFVRVGGQLMTEMPAFFAYGALHVEAESAVTGHRHSIFSSFTSVYQESGNNLAMLLAFRVGASAGIGYNTFSTHGKRIVDGEVVSGTRINEGLVINETRLLNYAQ